MSSKGKHGGARPGAGRPRTTNSKPLGMRLSAEIWHLRDQIADKTGETKRAVMERAIRELAARELKNT